MAKLEPIEVKSMRFVRSVDGPGLNADESCAAPHDKKPKSRHRIQYCPWLRQFRISYTPNSGPVDVGFVPEHMVMSWRPMHEVEAPSPPQGPRK